MTRCHPLYLPSPPPLHFRTTTPDEMWTPLWQVALSQTIRLCHCIELLFSVVHNDSPSPWWSYFTVSSHNCRWRDINLPATLLVSEDGTLSQLTWFVASLSLNHSQFRRVVFPSSIPYGTCIDKLTATRRTNDSSGHKSVGSLVSCTNKI